jgi:GT2 family glycosyltransferase
MFYTNTRSPSRKPVYRFASVLNGRLAVVIVTRNRARSLVRTLEKLETLPDRPAILVVDNASSDRTDEIVRRRHPDVEVIRLPENHGAAARTHAARAVGTPYVAFSDDDSWWAPGALARGAELLDRYARLGLVAGRVLVGADERLDPISSLMALSPLPATVEVPGRPILGFVACGAILRREAFVEVGGFHPRLGIGGEEELLAIDLAAAGWRLTYVDDVVAHHWPDAAHDRAGRTRIQVRNALWSAWLRRRSGGAIRRTRALTSAALADASARHALVDALRGLPWVVRERRPVPADLERALRLVVG